ncbi:MAG: S24/S26 family peptidase [Clostridia bacterium]|nr:S24/S26 family peptidase [Clostridia bacterium]
MSGRRCIGMEELSPIILEAVQKGRSVRMRVVGNSMYPMLRSGIDSVVLVRADSCKRGDIPLYRRENGSFVLHRVISVSGGAYTMCGDNQTTKEFPVYESQIYGKVKGFYRGGRYISCKNPLYRAYSFVWTVFFRFRPVFAKLIKAAKVVKKGVGI